MSYERDEYFSEIGRVAGKNEYYLRAYVPNKLGGIVDVDTFRDGSHYATAEEAEEALQRMIDGIIEEW